MKFIHIADLHLDCPFTNLSDKENFGELRRLEQRKALREVINYIKENKIQYLFIAGDLYEHKYVKKTTIEYINKLFNEIPETKIYITPGNHDPYTKNSFYNNYIWSKNVYIFGEQIQVIKNNDIDIYGYGFDDYYLKEEKINNIEIENSEKINILITHGTLDGASLEEKEYNSIPRRLIEEKGFDYVALGHIHKTNYKENENIIYPGSMVSIGFDEIGLHGMIEGEIINKKLKTKYIPIKTTEFEELELDVTEIISKEELIEKIQEINFEENKLYKIILIGKRNFEINTYELYKYNLNEKIIKIKNKSKINYNLEDMKNETTLKGLFAGEILEILNKCQTEEERKIIENAIEIGIDVLEW